LTEKRIQKLSCAWCKVEEKRRSVVKSTQLLKQWCIGTQIEGRWLEPTFRLAKTSVSTFMQLFCSNMQDISV